MDQEPQSSGKGPTAVKAVLERIIWRNERRIIASARPSGRREIGVIGDMVDPQAGQLYEFVGNWKKNDRYNKWDLYFYSYRTILPQDRTGIYHYLVRVAKWVGPETAEILLDRYGDDTLCILKEEPQRVIADQVHGLTAARVEELTKTLRDNEKLEQAMIEVGNLVGGVLGQYAVERAIARWGADAAHIIQRNPYRLEELDGVGFVRADSIYLKMGRAPDAARRSAHAILHVLQEQAAQNGHTRIRPATLQIELVKLVTTPHPRALALLQRAKKIRVSGEQYIAHADLANAEEYTANKLTLLRTQQHKPLVLDEEVRVLIGTLEDDQLTAFLRAQEEPVMLITGAPGTGKTYTLARIIALYLANNLSVSLAAPTGKAAKQMEMALSATVGLPARTIHSLLEAEVVDGEFGFQRNEENPLTCNVLVIDETSMVDVRLARALLKAVPGGCRLLLVGDHYQLPSVGPGALLRDVLKAGVPNVELRKIKRHAGRIVHACHMIKDGLVPEPSSKLDLPKGENWRHIESPIAEHTLNAVRALLRQKLPEMGLDPIWQVQLISPTNEAGPLSCLVLNRVVKEIVNPGLNMEKLPFGLNDKVVRIKNGKVETVGEVSCGVCKGSGESLAYPGQKCVSCAGRGSVNQGGEVRIVNGDLGVVRKVDEKFIYVDFLYPDRAVRIPRKTHDLRLAYCLTCHKMQGSEVDVVILPIHKQFMHLPMVTREWIYTALSRAKKFILTIGSLDHLPRALARIGNETRTTALTELLQKCG